MSFEFTSLVPLVTQIFTAPGTDLQTISAKRVRKQLPELDPTLTRKFIRQHKVEVDAVIEGVYRELNSENYREDDTEQEEEDEQEDEPEVSDTPLKRKQESDEDEATPGSDTPDKPPRKKAKKKTDSDALLARKLSNEINGRASRRSTAKPKANAKKTGGRSRKSAAIIEDSDEEEGDKPAKKRSKGAAKGGFAKEFFLSAPLAALLETEKLSRPQVVKQLWVYIKENGLQNPENKREIICDPKFKAVFGGDKVGMFRMNKILGQHLIEADE